MWDYTGKVLDHFRNPRNVGLIPDPDGVGMVGSLACGDALKLTFKLDAQKERIADVKFQTFGCASAIASSSALTEMIMGKTLAEAGRVTNRDIADYLGGLPEQKMHCSVMGREALEAAIENYRTGTTGKRVLEGKVICTCFGVTEEEVDRVCRENHLTTVEQVTHYSKAGGGCGRCHPDLRRIIEKVQRERETARPRPAAARLTNLQRIQRIGETMNREIRPLLQRDGGDVELIDVVGTRVIVSFRGLCSRCQASERTRQDVVEAKLREFVAGDITVEEDAP